MILDTVDIGAPWKVLPPGVHDATLSEIKTRFATTPYRKALYDGFFIGCAALKAAGCSIVYLDGSYVTDKSAPRDFDACWDPIGVDPAKLDPVLLDLSPERIRQKRKYGGEFFPSSILADGTRTFVDFFRIDKHTGKEKGIIRIRLQ